MTRVRYCNQMTASERTYTSHEHRWLQYYSHVFHHFPAKTAADGEEQGWAWSKGRNSTHSRICLRRKVRTKLINGSKDQNLTGSQMHQVQFSPHYGQTITSILRRASTISCQYYRIQNLWLYFASSVMCLTHVFTSTMPSDHVIHNRAPEDKKVSLTCHDFNLSTKCQR